ncbi:hypothetical protein [Galbibacter sp. EGI 63066]|uniref:hypothetical protein n=1 Tax=Galbibacter sp. EGI 63066 TaxID=2993559 RepID=UPI003A520C43
MGLRKVNTIGLKQANKCMQLSAIAYNLKKYLKFIEKHTKSGAASIQELHFVVKTLIQHILNIFRLSNFRLHKLRYKIKALKRIHMYLMILKIIGLRNDYRCSHTFFYSKIQPTKSFLLTIDQL